MRIGFVVDCGPGIGMGRLSRCLVLAKVAIDAGCECLIALSHVDGLQICSDRGVPATADGAQSFAGFDWIVVDGWRSAGGFSASDSGRTKVLAISDLADRPCSANILLNHNIYARELSYSRYHVDRCLLGTDYALISAAFVGNAEIRASRPARPATVLATFGGAEDGSRLAPVVKAMLELCHDDIRKIIAVISPASSVSDDMKRVACDPKIQLLHGADMPAVFAEADIYVGGAGVSVLEAIASGTAIVAVGVAPDQQHNLQALKQLGIPVLNSPDPAQVASRLAEVMRGPARSTAISIDGGGARRVLDAMVSYDVPAFS